LAFQSTLNFNRIVAYRSLGLVDPKRRLFDLRIQNRAVLIHFPIHINQERLARKRLKGVFNTWPCSTLVVHSVFWLVVTT